MYQRQVCPSTGVLRRLISQNVVTGPNCFARSFHLSARWREENDPAATPAPSPNNFQDRGVTRRTRQAAGAREVANLQFRRPFPSNAGQRSPRPGPQSSDESQLGRSSAENAAAGQPGQLIRRTPVGGSAPQGQMIRMSTNLRTKASASGNTSGPSLRGGRTSSGGSRGPRGTKENQPGRRKKDATKKVRFANDEDVKIEDTLSDGMVKQLMRLQMKEWEKRTYEPKYAHGSPAALDLIEQGKQLCAGEVRTKKVPGRLERVIGVAGMHGT